MNFCHFVLASGRNYQLYKTPAHWINCGARSATATKTHSGSFLDILKTFDTQRAMPPMADDQPRICPGLHV